MILPGLVALLTAGGALLRGSWDLWAQCLLHLAVVFGFAAWFLGRIFVGFIPIPSSRVLAWAGVLAVLSAASAWSSPIPGVARGEWYVFLEGLWIFTAITALSKDERGWIDQAIRAAAWILMTLAFYQRFIERMDRPTSALLNQNVYAGAILMLLPLALERRDTLLAAGLLLNLWWCRSAGAWLGLAGALALTQRRVHPIWARVGMGVALVSAVVVYGRLDSPEVLHRWGWWRAAWAMILDRPLRGYGPGTFAATLPAYREFAPYGLYSLYAHQYFLEFAAGFGIPAALLWFGGVWRCVAAEGQYKRFAAIAVLIHSLWDYTLSIPSNFWLFCYCAASAIPDTPRGVNVPSPYKASAAALVVGLALAAGGRVWTIWTADRLSAAAGAAMEEGGDARARALLERSRRVDPWNAERALLASTLELREASRRPPAARGGSWLAAAADLEEAARLEPYRPSTWTQLASLYRAMGRAPLAAMTEHRADRLLAR